MSADRDNSQESAGFTTKQKMMAGGVVVILGVLVWQVYGMMGGSSDSPAPVTPVANKTAQPGMKPPGQMTSTMPGTTQPGAMPMQNPTGNMNNPMQQNVPPQPQPVPGIETQANNNVEMLKKQKDQQEKQQEKFLTTVNELQMLKLQKDIAETNQAISAAKLATATAEKNINELLIKPVPAPTPVSNYASSLVSPVATGGSQMNGPNGPATPPPAVSAPVDVGPVPYVVISVSMQMNKWTAVLGASGKLYNVSTGDVLSDGWVVGHIGKEGVVLKKTGVSKKVSLIPVI